MNIKAKTALIIIITLALGIVIGAMLNRALIQRRINRAFSWRLPDFMITNFENIIEPSQEQRKRLREVYVLYVKTPTEKRKMYLHAFDKPYYLWLRPGVKLIGFARKELWDQWKQQVEKQGAEQ